jgi:predicted alpha/beta hydrolase
MNSNQMNRQPKRAPVVLLLAPAMGVPAAFYTAFAESLEDYGVSVRVLELPGQGESPRRAQRGDDYGYREVVEELIPGSILAARRERPDARIVLAGHSLGGQLATVACAEAAPMLDGLVLIAAGTAHWRRWPRRSRLRAWLTVHAISGIAALLPWYPGDRMGFGGAQCRRFMRDWRHNARTGGYVLEGSVRTEGVLQTQLQQVRLPVLALPVRGDAIAPEGAVTELLGHLPSARVRRIELNGNTAHTPWKRHFSWAKKPAGVQDALLEWLADDSVFQSDSPGVPDDTASNHQGGDARDPAAVPVA